MATTGIWKITKRLDHVIAYITNLEKTLNEEYGKEVYKDLHSLEINNDSSFTTEKPFLTSGINCSVESAYEEMLITKKHANKENGILGFHAFQSFAEKEVTPELAHKIGLKLAEEMWGDRFEVVVSTHCNTNHIHNHFVINSVSFQDGKRYYDNRNNYAKLRHLSDSLCKEFGLSVLKEKKCKHSNINYENYYKSCIEKNDYYATTKRDLDLAIAQAYSYKDFECLMKTMNYELIYRAGRLSVKRYPYKKNIRIERYYGEDYSIEQIMKRLKVEHAPRTPFVEEYGHVNFKKKYVPYKKQKSHGLKALYLHYCYLLKIFPTQYPEKKLSPEIRVDIKKLDEISAQTEMLVRNHLDTYELFLFYKNQRELELESAIDKREKLWYHHKIANNELERKEIKEQLSSLNIEIKFLRKEVKLCEDIDGKSQVIHENIDNFENREEKKRNELLK